MSPDKFALWAWVLGIFVLGTVDTYAVTCPVTGQVAQEEVGLGANMPRLARKLRVLREHEAACLDSAEYAALRGSLHLSVGEYEEAVLWLERALLLDPAQAGAQVDYALALRALGQESSARAFAHTLLSLADLPPAARQALESVLAPGPAAAQAEASAVRHADLTLRLGYDHNPLNAPSRNAITLTLPTGPLGVELAPAFQARGSFATQADLRYLQVQSLSEEHMWYALGEFKQYHYTENSRAKSTRLDGGVGLLGPCWSAGANVTALRLDGDIAYRDLRLSGEWSLTGKRGDPGTSGCFTPRAGVQVDALAFPQNPELDGLLLAASLSLRCQLGIRTVDLTARWGRDDPTGDRPGGASDLGELRLLASQPLAQGQLTLEVLANRLADREGYSPLFSRGERRTVRGLAAALEYTRPLSGRWELLASLEISRYRSNIDLFDTRGQAAYLGLRYRLLP